MMSSAACLTPRPAIASDARACAELLNAWIDSCDWMPRVHSHADVVDYYQHFVFAKREVWVIGDPVMGFITLDVDENMVSALYTATPGKGLGRALLDQAKHGRDLIALWTFVANDGARRFYAREGFRQIRRTEGDNEEGLPDILLQWERAA